MNIGNGKKCIDFNKNHVILKLNYFSFNKNELEQTQISQTYSMDFDILTSHFAMVFDP